MLGLLVLICRGVRQIRRKWYRKVRNPQKFSKCRLKNWCKNLILKRSQLSYKPDSLFLRFGFIVYTAFLNKFDEAVTALNREQHDLKWTQMQCQNGKCDARRKDKELRICGNCGVVRYCSRKCQKIDWVEGDHRLDCNRLKTMCLEHDKLLIEQGNIRLYAQNQL